MKKKCFKCGKIKDISKFYKHPKTKDGYLNKCKECTKKDNKISNGKEIRKCVICGKIFHTTINEIKRRGGGGYCCSRKCYYKRQKEIIKKGKDSPNWKGGRITCSSGYIIIYNPNHIRADNKGYVFEHLLVMEKKIGRPVKKVENVHHINGIKNDNRIENLMLFSTMSEHMKYHWKQEKLNEINRYNK